MFLTNIAQESSGTKGVLGPTKIYLAVQPPDSQSSSVQKTSTMTTNAVQTTSTKQIESSSRPSVIPAVTNIPKSSTQLKTSEQVKQKKSEPIVF